MSDLLNRHRTWWQSGILVVLGMVVFWPSASFDFVNWDDPAYLEHNDLIKEWSWQNLKGIATEVVTRNYAPLTIFSFLLEHTLWGLNPAGYHITNIILHAINGVLVFLLVRRLSESSFVGWMTAALFLVHPVQIESVVWISSRKGLLCSMFMLGAMLARMKSQPTSRDEGRYVFFLALALFSKAHAVVLPPIMLLYDLLVRKKTVAEALPRQVIPGQTIVFQGFRLRHKQWNRNQRFAATVLRSSNSFEVRTEFRSLRRVFAVWGRHENSPLVNEPRDLINMPVGVVANNTMSWQPDDVFRLKPGRKHFCHALNRRAGIAIWIEQATGCRQNRPGPIPFNRAAFKDQFRPQSFDPECSTDATGGKFVEIPGRIFSAPRIVVPVDDDLFAGRLRSFSTIQEYRTVIATPRIVDGDIVQLRSKPASSATTGRVNQWSS